MLVIFHPSSVGTEFEREAEVKDMKINHDIMTGLHGAFHCFLFSGNEKVLNHLVSPHLIYFKLEYRSNFGGKRDSGRCAEVVRKSSTTLVNLHCHSPHLPLHLRGVP